MATSSDDGNWNGEDSPLTDTSDEKPVVGKDAQDQIQLLQPACFGICSIRVHVDTPYSWFILFTCVVAAGLPTGIPLSGGVITDALIEELNCTAAEAGWVSSLEMAFVFFSGPLTGAVLHYLSIPPVCVSAVVISCLIRVAQFYSTNLWHLYITAVAVGLAQGVILYSTNLVVSNYFRIHRPMAFIILPTGATIVGLCLPSLMSLVIDTLGVKYSFLICGAIATVVLPLVVLWTQTDQDESKAEFDQSMTSESSGDKHWVVHLKNEKLWLEAACLLLWSFGSQPIFIFMVNYTTSLGVENPLLITSLIGIGGLCGKIPYSLIAYFDWISQYNLYFVTLSANSVLSLALAYDGGYYYFCGLAFFFGFTFFGLIGPMLFLMMNDTKEQQRRVHMVMAFLAQAIGNVVASPAAGLIQGYYGYQVALIVSGAITTSGLLPLALTRILSSVRHRRGEAIPTQQNSLSEEEERKLGESPT